MKSLNWKVSGRMIETGRNSSSKRWQFIFHVRWRREIPQSYRKLPCFIASHPSWYSVWQHLIMKTKQLSLLFCLRRWGRNTFFVWDWNSQKALITFTVSSLLTKIIEKYILLICLTDAFLMQLGGYGNRSAISDPLPSEFYKEFWMSQVLEEGFFHTSLPDIWGLIFSSVFLMWHGWDFCPLAHLRCLIVALLSSWIR